MTIARLKTLARNIKLGDSLRHRALRAGGWTIFGHLANQGLRLAGNLVLTRLLFPEAFGLMAIVQSVIVGLTLFSDVGLEVSIIQNKRGQEEVFVNTAWTLQVLKGIAIWLLLCLLAPFVGSFYSEAILTSLMPVVGLNAVIGGLASTKLALANRALALRQRVLIEVGGYALGLLVTILWAWLDRSVWSLVGGGLFTAAVKTIASHAYLPGPRNRFAWERDSVKALFGFGQWVLLSSVLTFFAGEGNKLLVAAFLGVKMLAFFTLASTMSGVMVQVLQQLSSRVMFPAYAEVVRERPETLGAVVARSRLFLLVPAWLIALFFLFWGDNLMWLLYDQRYAQSGVMLRMLAMGEIVSAIGMSYNGILFAKGMVRTMTAILVAEITFRMAGMVIGYHFLGERGVVLSAAAVPWLLYPVLAYVHVKIGTWQPRQDLPLIVVSIALVAASFSTVYAAF